MSTADLAGIAQPGMPLASWALQKGATATPAVLLIAILLRGLTQMGILSFSEGSQRRRG